MLALLLVCFAVSFLLVGRMPTGKPKSSTAAP